WVDPNVDDIRHVEVLRRVQRKREFLHAVDMHAIASAGARDCDMIDRPEVAHIRMGVEPALFGVDLKAQYAIIEHDDDDTYLVAPGGLQLCPAMGESAVAG